MSASNAPPNPGTPRQNPRAPKSSLLGRRPGLLASAAAVGAVAVFYLARPPAPRSEPVVSMRTPGVANIERAYTNAGATPTHTKAYGGTVQGDKEAVALREDQPAGSGAPPNAMPMERDGVGDEQRPGQKSKIGEAFNHTQYGTEKGK